MTVLPTAQKKKKEKEKKKKKQPGANHYQPLWNYEAWALFKLGRACKPIFKLNRA
jgi:hypothetical protein